jgi:hypothetical protein
MTILEPARRSLERFCPQRHRTGSAAVLAAGDGVVRSVEVDGVMAPVELSADLHLVSPQATRAVHSARAASQKRLGSACARNSLVDG